jgi:2-hydroxychromene-2-carboxylate isomerase
MRDALAVSSEEPRFYLGAMSPYSWFAAERISALLPEAVWCPLYAGGLFRANDRSTWGLSDRRVAGMADCEARARAHDLGPIVWPDPWPTNDITIARALKFAQRLGVLHPLALAAMRLAFLKGGDLGELSVVLEAGERAGIESATLTSALAEPSIKDALRSANDEAVSLGVFGVPTVIVGGELFWGDDRLDDAVAARGPSLL